MNKTFFNQSDWSEALIRWDRYVPPFRPSLGDIEIYSSVLRKFKKNKKILILGATPEIRNILSKFNSFVMVADFSSEMILGMSLLEKNIKKDKEQWLRANWLDLNNFLKNDYFDVVIGDLALRNIDFNQQSRFLKNISKLLKKQGTFITRLHFLNKDIININANKIISDVFKKNKDLDDKLLEDLITSRLFDKNTDFKTKTINKKRFAYNIDIYINENCQNKREELILKNIVEKWVGQRTWIQRKEKETDNLILKYFLIKNKRISSDYKDSEFYPIYTLIKK